MMEAFLVVVVILVVVIVVVCNLSACLFMPVV